MTMRYLGALALLSLLLGCKKEELVVEALPQEVGVMIVAADTIYKNISASVTVAGAQEVSLSARASGPLVSVSARLGDRVKKGVPLFAVESAVQKAAYEQAKVSREEALLSLEAIKKLHEKGSVSKAEFLAAQSRYSASQAQVSSGFTQLRDCQITAPFDGSITMVDRSLEVGNAVSPGVPLVRLVSITTLKTPLFLGEREVGQVKVGDKATLVVSAVQDTLRGKVVRLSEGADPATGSFTAELLFDNRSFKVKAGMSGEVSLTSQVSTIGLMIPVTAISPRGTVAKISKGVVTLVPVKSEPLAGNRAIITGVFAGDTIALTGIARLATGDKVKISRVAPASDKRLL